MIPYEVYFYSSGAVEERLDGRRISGSTARTSSSATRLGGLLSFALMISAGALLLPQGINAELLGTVALVAQAPLGQIGLILALVGILFAVSRRRDRLRLRGRLQRRPVLRLGVGQVPPQRRRAALHARVDRDARARRS